MAAYRDREGFPQPLYFLQGISDLATLLELLKLVAEAGMVRLVTSLTQTVEDRMVTQEPIRSRAGLAS